MINFLFRADANNSEILLTKILDDKLIPLCVKKSASTQKSIARLKRESKGALWYSNSCQENLILSTTDLPEYYSIKFNFVPGKKINYKNGYWNNRYFIEKAIERYCKIWKKIHINEMIIHGDYSLDNIIFNDERVVIIDWEHFSNVRIPKGFDALNLIYEQLYMLSLKQKIDQKVISHANFMLEKIFNNKCLDKEFFIEPLKTTQKYILDNKIIWENQIDKLPIMKFDPFQSEEIDLAINIR